MKLFEYLVKLTRKGFKTKNFDMIGEQPVVANETKKWMNPNKIIILVRMSPDFVDHWFCFRGNQR